jgi:tetratricopeptide (TPR) repeat protein
MSRVSVCPDRQDLERLLLGQLEGPEALDLELHFEHCEHCLRAVRVPQPDDPLVAVVRASSVASRAGETEVSELLIEKLCGLRSELLDTASAVGPSVFLQSGHPASPREPGTPARIGSYRVLRLLGTGGMGEVYLAQQQWPRRQVALKMVGAASRVGRERLYRFRAEAEMIARLQHPHIVQLYDVGEHEGRPFFTMEHVEGGSLARRLAQAPLAARDAARLLETLARAIHAAHGLGIIHRDLKPSNILLTADGTPKVSDFGVAKQLEEPADGESPGCRTESGAVLGTPCYMAPEQADGRGQGIGPAVDVYALGAVLYEALTGRPPFQAAGVLETLDLVRAREPVPPRRFQPGVGRDLETICLKCLEKEPARRYASALDLADDLGRYLRGETVRARPAGPLERLHKWARRRPAQAGLVAVSVAAVLALAAGVLWHNGSLRKEVRRAEAAEKRARANYRQARDTVSRMLGRLDDGPRARAPRVLELKKEQTEDALAFYQAVVGEGDEEDPAVRLDVALAYFRCGVIEFALSRFDDSGKSLEQARVRFESLAESDPANLDNRSLLADCWNRLGHLHTLRRGPGDDPLRCYREALAIREGLSRANPGDAALRAQVAGESDNVANALFSAGRLKEARSSREKTLALDRELVREHPEVADNQWELAVGLVNAGESWLADGQAAKAEAAYLEAEALLERVLRGQPENLTLACNFAEAYGSRVWALLGTGRFTEAVALCTRAIGVVEGFKRREPQAMEINQVLSGLWKERALAYGLAGDEAAAMADWTRAAAAAEKTTTVLARLNGALAQAHLGDHEAAARRAEPAGPADQLFHQALVYAACARAAADDRRLPADGRAALARKHAAAALTLLEQAQAAGMLRNPAHAMLLRQGPSFASLRRCGDFGKLLRQLEAGPPAAP